MDITTPFLILIPIVIGLVQVVKVTGLPSRWFPLTSIILGVLGAFVIGTFKIDSTIIIQGLVAGLSAAGLWSGVKTSIVPTTPTV